MKLHTFFAGLTATLMTFTSAAAAPANTVTPQDIRSVVGLIKYLYAGYDNGANERKSFYETVPWDIDTGALIERAGRCQTQTGEEIIDHDWPSDSQDSIIKNLSVTYEGSSGPRRATVRATFSRDDPKPVVIHYDMTLYQEAPLERRWGVSNIRVQDSDGTDDLLKDLKSTLAGECKAFK
jgi:hypothetical protein